MEQQVTLSDMNSVVIWGLLFFVFFWVIFKSGVKYDSQGRAYGGCSGLIMLYIWLFMMLALGYVTLSSGITEMPRELQGPRSLEATWQIYVYGIGAIAFVAVVASILGKKDEG